jgi:hypothetical protein
MKGRAMFSELFWDKNNDNEMSNVQGSYSWNGYRRMMLLL